VSVKDDAAREAAVFDNMMPGWHKAYVTADLWTILLLRREPELVEHLAREVCSRILNDSLDELTLRRAIQEVRKIKEIRKHGA
jgi:hypothetical protein